MAINDIIVRGYGSWGSINDLPTLVIWGAEDKVFPIANAERLRTDIEGSEVHIIEDAGHLPQLEQTEAFLDVLLPFLEEQ